MKIIVFIALLISFSLSLLSSTIKSGQMISCDSSNEDFTLTSNGLSNNLYLLLFTHENIEAPFDTEITCPYYDSSAKNWTSKDYVNLMNSKSGSCSISFNLKEGDRGNFFIYDFQAKYKIKLKNKYGNIKARSYWFTHLDNFDESISKLTFLVPNFRTNSTITFEYEQIYENFKNPFQVCHEGTCKENVTTYDFKQGQSYEIYVKLQEIDTYEGEYGLPPFTFYAQDYNDIYSNDDIEAIYDKTNNNQKKIIINKFIYLLLVLLLI